MNLLLLLLAFVYSTAGDPVRVELSECASCNKLVDRLYRGFKDQVPLEIIEKEIVDACSDLKIYTPTVCQGFVHVTLPTLLYIHQNSRIAQGNICGILLVGLNCSLSDPESLEWNISLSSAQKPPITDTTRPKKGLPTLKVLHLSDIHWDPEYQEGSNAVCGEPLCCRSSSGNVRDVMDQAGYWGDYRQCDLPWRTVENAMAQISKQHQDVDYIMWTGDWIPHNIWSTSREEVMNITREMFNLFRQYFPRTPVYPTLGNHESHPLNAFAPPDIKTEEFGSNWLYDEADKQWSNWLPPEASETVRYGGYYTALIQPGFRIISLNMNYCYVANWWIFYRSKDPASSLSWLVSILEKAEANNEKVHIMSHVPPGNNDCWSIFAREYSKIINRFESTIAAQFFGHTHNDEFKIFYNRSDNSPRATSVAFIGPSLTTYSRRNPGYKIYTVDGQRPNSTRAVLNHNTWFMNLTAANANPLRGPVWKELYQASSEYQIPHFSPIEMNRFVKRMAVNDTLFQLYFKNYYKASDDLMEKGCSSDCKIKLLCSAVTTNIWDTSRCDDIKRIISGHH